MNKLEENKKKKNNKEKAEEAIEEEVASEEAANETENQEDFKDKLLRTMAEFDNFKKRTAKEKDAMYEYAVADTVGKILPVIDTLKLSLNHADEEDPVRKGVELTLKQFDEVLAKLNVSEIEALGKTFDPNLHNAVMHIDDDSYGEQEVVEVLQNGYIINDRVIRYSMVKVAN